MRHYHYCNEAREHYHPHGYGQEYGSFHGPGFPRHENGPDLRMAPLESSSILTWYIAAVIGVAVLVFL